MQITSQPVEEMKNRQLGQLDSLYSYSLVSNISMYEMRHTCTEINFANDVYRVSEYNNAKYIPGIGEYHTMPTEATKGCESNLRQISSVHKCSRLFCFTWKAGTII